MSLTPIDNFIGWDTGVGSPVQPDALRRWQLAELKNTLAYAAANSQFYRRKLAGLDFDSLRSAADLAKLPFTTAAEVRENGADLLAAGSRDVSRVVTIGTSGTTGASKRVFFTDEDEERTMDYFAMGMTDIAPPDSLTLVLLGSCSPGGVGDLLARCMERVGRRGLACGPLASAEEVLELIREKNAQTLVGPPVLINRLAASGPAPVKSVLLTADYIPDPLAASIASRWGCEVFKHYGLTETGFAGCVECRAHDGMHIRESDLLFEIIDPQTGRRLPPGEIGEVVFSTLRRKGMPLVRYRTGDLSSLLPGRCRCGSAVRRIGKVLGRRENIVTLPGGKSTISIHQLDETLFKFGGLLDYEASLEDGLLRLGAELTDQAQMPSFISFVAEALPLSCEVTPAEFPLYKGPGKRRLKCS